MSSIVRETWSVLFVRIELFFSTKITFDRLFRTLILNSLSTSVDNDFWVFRGLYKDCLVDVVGGEVDLVLVLLVVLVNGDLFSTWFLLLILVMIGLLFYIPWNGYLGVWLSIRGWVFVLWVILLLLMLILSNLLAFIHVRIRIVMIFCSLFVCLLFI